MRKSQIESKLDRKFCHIAKDQAIKIKILERFENDDKKRDMKLEDDDDFDLLDAQS